MTSTFFCAGRPRILMQTTSSISASAGSIRKRGFLPSARTTENRLERKIKIKNSFLISSLYLDEIKCAIKKHILDVPRRQVVFTIPKMARLFFRFRRKLLNDLCLTAVRTLVKFLHTAIGLELVPGAVAAIQTFGGRINFHPNLHFLVTEGGVDRTGAFHLVAGSTTRGSQ